MYSKTNKIILFLIMTMLVLGGCSSGGGGDSATTTSTTTTSLSGVAQKGAFLKDSNVSLCKLDEKLVCTSEKLEIKVSDDKGSYEFKTLPWSGLSRLTISGYYLDELTGAKSLSPATITAIVDIKSNTKQKSNTNLLTDLRAKRMKKLVDEGKSKEDADRESKEEVKQLFNVSSDDFTELDITDFSAGKASVNAELLRLSAAIAKSSNPVGDLEKLMEIYNEGGLAAVLESRLYKKLMSDADEVDVKETLTTMGVTSDVVNDIPLSDIKITPFVRASMSTTDSSQVFLTLFGTEVNSTTPNINMNVEGDELSFTLNSISDDNKTIMLDINESSSCKDLNLTFVIEYDSLVGVNGTPLQTNKMQYSDPMTICSQTDDTGVPITVPQNQLPVAVIGEEYSDVEINEVNITAYAGQRVSGLKSAYSYDRDPYPFGGIIHCQWKDENSVVLKEENHASCDLSSHVINELGVYHYTLTVTDRVGATDTSVANITVVATQEMIDIADLATLTAAKTAFDALENGQRDFTYEGVTVAYNPISVKVPTVSEQTYDVTVTFTKGTQELSATFSERVAASQEMIDKADLATLTAAKTAFDALENGQRDFTYAGVTVTFNPVSAKTPTISEQTYDVTATFTKGTQVLTSTFSEKVEAVPIEITLNDINTSIVVKGQDAFPDQGQSGVAATLETAPQHGTVEFYLVGNESPYIQYTSTDCFIGKDSFIYKSGNDYGRVNVTITSASTLQPLSETKTLLNTEAIEGEFLRAKSASEGVSITTAPTHGVASFTIVANEVINYNYDPENDYVGDDFFEYQVSETIDECSYSAVGRIDFIVKSLAPVVTAPTQAGFRTLLSSDNPKDSDQFGSGVAIEGDTIVVGVPGHQIEGSKSSGEIIVYQKTENGVEEVQHIQNPDLQNEYIHRRFGYTIALKDGFLAVAAPGMQTTSNRTTIYSNITKVYVYKQEDNNSFTYLQTFDDVSNDSESYFAFNNIDINKNYLVIGAKNETVNSTELVGAAYVYKKDGEYFASNPTRLSDVNLTKYGGYATKVALMDELVLVSMPNKKVYEAQGDTDRYGAVYVYKDSGSGLEQVSVLNSPQIEVDPNYAYSASFGASLGVNGNMLAIGIPNASVDGLSDVGYVDVYMRSDDAFTLLSRTTDTTPVQGENFGTTVAIENPYLIVSNTATSNADDTSKAERVQIYQYGGVDSNYTRVDEFEHIPTYRTWSTFQERPSFGAELDISDGIVMASSEFAFNFSRLQSRSYRAGQVYLIETDLQRPYWIDYKSSIVRPDSNNYFNANISKPDALEFVSSGAGLDSALFTYDKNYINYGTYNMDACTAACDAAGSGEECYMQCEEEGGVASVLDFYNPTDTNSDNKYEVDMKLTYDGKEAIYPLTWEVIDSMNFTEGHNDGMYFSQYDYNRLQLTGVGTKDYASELMFQDAKAYVRSSDSIYIYNKDLTAPELLSNDSKISISDIVSTSEINTSNVTTFLDGFPRASFDVDGSYIATMSNHTNKITVDNKFIYETDSYIHLFNNGNYEQSIVVHRDTQNIYPCTDNEVCRKDHKALKGVQIEHGMVFAAYQNYDYYHDDNLTAGEKWEYQETDNESGVMIYSYNGSTYNLLQTIQVTSENSGDANHIAHMSEVYSFRADGEFLLINGGYETGDYNNPTKYIGVYKFNGTRYSLLQTFTLPTDAGRKWKASLENGFVLIENQRLYHTNLDTYIYKYDTSSDNFTLLDTITNEEAGATYTDGFTGAHIQVASDGDTYLYKRFYKRLEVGDFTTTFAGNAAYIGVFKLDETTNKFRFVGSFTHRDGNNYFAESFAIDGDVVIANTRNSNYLHSFKLSR